MERNSASTQLSDYAKNFFSKNNVNHQGKSSYPRVTRMLENFIVIWLDANIDESRDDYKKWLTEVRCVVHTVKTFNDADDCVDFLTEINDEKVFMIVSETLGQVVVPLIEELPQLDSIYIFCSDTLLDKISTNQLKKVKGIFTQIEDMCQSLKHSTRNCDRDWIPISIMSARDSSSRVLDLNELDQSFMYTQLVKEILLEIKFDHQSKNSFVDFCRLHYFDNNSCLQSIDRFDREYANHSPIWWYTKEIFIYSTLNRALRTQEIDVMIKMGFYMKDLHCQIERIFKKDFRNPSLLTVYRGQVLPNKAFEKLRQSKGGLLSFNNFLSTTSDQSVAYTLAISARDDPGSVGILFKIEINSVLSSIPFASLEGLTNFEAEEEILFSMHSVFRIDDLVKIDDRVWQVNLTSTTDTDQQLKDLTDCMRKTMTDAFQGNPWYRLGHLMTRMGELRQAERIYKTIFDLESISVNNSLSIVNCLYGIGVLQHLQDDPTSALTYLNNALQLFPPHSFEGIGIYNAIALVHRSLGNYLDALSFDKKSLEIAEKMYPAYHSNLAVINGSIGDTYLFMGNPSAALPFMKKRINIFEKSLPSNHPELSTGYGCIGEAYRRIGDYPRAYSYFEKTLQIQEKYLPANHFELAHTYNNLGLVHDSMGNYSGALSCFRMTLQIRQKTLPPDHVDLGRIYNNLGIVHYSMRDYLTALTYYQDALKIYTKDVDLYNSDLAVTYNNIGTVYEKLGDPSTALSFFQKTLEVELKCFSPDHPTLATTYTNISSGYLLKKDYTTTLLYLEKARQIHEKVFPPNLPALAEIHNNIGWTYHLMADYSTALTFLQKAQQILERIFPSNHPTLIQTYKNMAEVHRKMGNYSAALSFERKYFASN